MRYILDRVAEALLKPVNAVVTDMVGLYTVIWGLWMLSPWWDVLTHAALYSQMIDLIPYEWAWGLIAISAGLVTVVGSILGYQKTIVRGSAASGLHWFLIAVLYFMGDAANTGGITAIFLAILCAYIYLNCKVRYFLDQNCS